MYRDIEDKLAKGEKIIKLYEEKIIELGNVGMPNLWDVLRIGL